MELAQRTYRTVSYVSGPLIFVEGASRFPYAAKVLIRLGDGREKHGQVLDVSREHAVVQVMDVVKRAGIDRLGMVTEPAAEGVSRK